VHTNTGNPPAALRAKRRRTQQQLRKAVAAAADDPFPLLQQWFDCKQKEEGR
jgi:hypothetical protein